MIREYAGPNPQYATKEQVANIVFKALKDAKFRKVEPLIWERPIQGAEVKTQQIVNGLGPYFPDIKMRGGEEILQFKDLRKQEGDYVITMTGKFGSLVFTKTEVKLRVVEQWINEKQETPPKIKIPNPKIVNVRLPNLKPGMHYQPYQFEKWCSPDDIPGLIQFHSMKPGDHLQYTYEIISPNSSNIPFREWLRVRTDTKRSFYLIDPVHKKQIDSIKAKIVNYKQLYLSFVNEDYEVEEGHHRIIAAALLGAQKFPVMVVRLIKASM